MPRPNSYAVFCLKKKSALAEAAIEAFDAVAVTQGPGLVGSLLVGLSFGKSFFFFNDTAPTEIYTLSLHDALPIFHQQTQNQRYGSSHIGATAKDKRRAIPLIQIGRAVQQECRDRTRMPSSA